MDGTCPRAFLPELSPRIERRGVLLRDLPEHAAQPAPRLHDGAHAVAAGARPHDQRLRVAFPAGGARARRASTPSDCVDFWDLTNRQDWHVCELSQAGISSRAYVPGPYSNREDLLYAFDQFIVEFHRNELATVAPMKRAPSSSGLC